MGTLSPVLPRPIGGRGTRLAGAAVAAAASVALLSAVLDLGSQAIFGVVVGAVFLAVGLVAGLGAVVLVGALLQTVAVAVALAVAAPGDEVLLAAVPCALLLWATFELAAASLAHRPSSQVVPVARVARIVDLVILALAGAALAGLALLASAVGPELPIDVRLATLAGTVVVVGVVGWLSRPRGRRR